MTSLLATLLVVSMGTSCVSQHAYRAVEKDFTPPPRDFESPVKFYIVGSSRHFGEDTRKKNSDIAAGLYPGLFTTDSNAVLLSISGISGRRDWSENCLELMNGPIWMLTLGIIPSHESHVDYHTVTASIPDVRDRGLLSRNSKKFEWQRRMRFGNILSPFAHIPLSKPYDLYTKGKVKKGEDSRRKTAIEGVAAILAESDLEAIAQLYYQNTFKP